MASYDNNAAQGGTATGPKLLMVAPSAPARAGDASALPKEDRPDYQRPEYDAAQPALQLCRDLMEGTAAIHAAGQKYLPRHPKESSSAYEVRRTIAEVFRAFARTVQAAVGMITATPPTLATDATPSPDIVSDCEDIDMHGTHLEVFAKQLLEDGIVSGVMAILVDYPPVPSTISLSLADELALNLRPYWVKISRDRIISWIVEAPDWKTIITDFKAGLITADQAKSYARQLVTRRVVIHEPTDVPKGAYGTVCVDRYRIITLTDQGVTFVVKEKRQTENGTVFDEVSSGEMRGAKNAPLRAIPLAVGYAGRKRGPFVADAPLLALAELNIGHYRVSANRRYLMELCHAPTLTLIGVDEYDGVDESGSPRRREISVGPNSALFVPLGGDAKYVAAAPQALDSSQHEKDDLLKQMAALGMSFLAKDNRGNQETALGRKLDDAAENATHATAARALQDVLEQALVFHAQYRGTVAPSVSVPTTYAADTVDATLAGVLWQAVAADRIPIEAFLEYVQTGKLPDDIDLDAVNEIRLAKQAIEAQRQSDLATATKKTEQQPVAA